MSAKDEVKRTTWENDIQWQARRFFIEKHRGSVPLEQLDAMSMVWANMKFLGCRYPKATEEKLEMLEATCVDTLNIPTETKKRKKIGEKAIIEGFVLYVRDSSGFPENAISLLHRNAQRAHKSIEFLELEAKDDLFSCAVVIGGIQIAMGQAKTKKEAKRNCADKAVEKLRASQPVVDEILSHKKAQVIEKEELFKVEATPECLPSAEEVKNDDCKREVLNKIPDRMINDNKLSKRKRENKTDTSNTDQSRKKVYGKMDKNYTLRNKVSFVKENMTLVKRDGVATEKIVDNIDLSNQNVDVIVDQNHSMSKRDCIKNELSSMTDFVTLDKKNLSNKKGSFTIDKIDLSNQKGDINSLQKKDNLENEHSHKNNTITLNKKNLSNQKDSSVKKTDPVNTRNSIVTVKNEHSQERDTFILDKKNLSNHKDSFTETADPLNMKDSIIAVKNEFSRKKDIVILDKKNLSNHKDSFTETIDPLNMKDSIITVKNEFSHKKDNVILDKKNLSNQENNFMGKTDPLNKKDCLLTNKNNLPIKRASSSYNVTENKKLCKRNSSTDLPECINHNISNTKDLKDMRMQDLFPSYIKLKDGNTMTEAPLSVQLKLSEDIMSLICDFLKSDDVEIEIVKQITSQERMYMFIICDWYGLNFMLISKGDKRIITIRK
ncbi:uncharacterized protein LOC124441278 [Xenia sp. Carnegie-2017]|uniref:uncharacterized protein LOC124441278 n=1 Tax=Xenia sp. Carnegie-2017 TaxID=2897299 RepID=UPI001F03E95E|nr:uncharacterized protein LOC124441278 [Xenia sp. Carnegie-2017]